MKKSDVSKRLSRITDAWKLLNESLLHFSGLTVRCGEEVNECLSRCMLEGRVSATVFAGTHGKNLPREKWDIPK